MIILSTSSVSESSISAFVFVRHAFWLISICKINHHTDIERSLCLPVWFCFYQLCLWSVSYTATLFITLVLIFIDMEHSLCLPVWFGFYQLRLSSVSYTATLFITLVLIFIDMEHTIFLLLWFWFYQVGLYCAQSVIHLLYLSLWNWFLFISNIHSVCQFDFAFINLVCFVFSQLYSYPIYHFGIDIYWYQTFYFSAGMILLLSTWFVLCSVSYTATLFITLELIFINIEHSLCLPVWFCFYQLGLCCVQSVIQLPYLSLWYWYLLISNILFFCWYDFAFINLVSAVLNQFYSYSIYHFGIDIY